MFDICNLDIQSFKNYLLLTYILFLAVLSQLLYTKIVMAIQALAHILFFTI